MRTLSDEHEIIELLSKYEFHMVNKLKPEGEMTTLNQKDIDDILYDMRHGVAVYIKDDGMVLVKYPRGQCTLESRGLLENN